MSDNTSTKVGREKRFWQIVNDYISRRNWSAVARLIGGSPRYDLQDLTDADYGEAPKGAEW